MTVRIYFGICVYVLYSYVHMCVYLQSIQTPDNGYADLNLPLETMTQNHIQQQFCLYSEYTSVGRYVCMQV